MDQRNYLSLDPGGSTGWAYRSPSGDITGGTLVGDDHHQELWDLMVRLTKSKVYLQIVCERFNYQRRQVDKGVGLEIISREYIGVAKLYAQRTGDVGLYMSQVSNKDQWSDNNLKLLDLYTGTAHQKDATRHLLWYLTNVEKLDSYLWVKKAR